MVDHLQDLEDLLASKGWAWLESKADEMWGDAAFVLQLERVAASDMTAEKKTIETERLWQQRKAAMGFLSMPKRAISEARQAYRTTTDTMSRRGAGL